MSDAFSPRQQWHTVTVKDGEATFECTALYGACHFYPSCSCEQWTWDHYAEYGPGHEREHHERCWLQDWFDIGEGSVSYAGPEYDDMQDSGIPPTMNRAGMIDAHCIGGEYVEWEFAEAGRG